MRKSPKTDVRRRISFEKKVAVQALVSLLVLIYGIMASKTNIAPQHKAFIHRAVNVTSDKNDIIDMVYTARDLSEKAVSTCGEYFDRLVYFCNNGFGEPPDSGEVLAREYAEPAIYPQKRDDVSASTPDNTEETQTQEEQQPEFRYPAVGEITSYFGERTHPIGGNESVHYGVDIAANHGDCIISSLPGVVSDTGFDPNLGNYVKVRHNDSLETVYGHMSEILVNKDEVVDGNTRIGSVGSTGAATGPHVHLEVRVDGVCRDPMEYLNHE